MTKTQQKFKIKLKYNKINYIKQKIINKLHFYKFL